MRVFGSISGDGDSVVDDRGQVVLVAGVAVALALAAMLAAFLQLGYHGDVATTGDGRSVADARGYLDRVTHDAARDLRGEYEWRERRQAADDLRRALRPRLRTLERSRAGSGVVATATFDGETARAWANDQCPGGRGREFGDCRADGGVVVQERDGRTLVVAVAYDLTVATGDATTELTVVVTPG